MREHIFQSSFRCIPCGVVAKDGVRFATRRSSCLDQVEFPGVDSGSGHAKHQRCVRIDLAGRPSLQINPGDLILNRQHDATLLQIFTAHVQAFAKFALPSLRLQESLPV